MALQCALMLTTNPDWTQNITSFAPFVAALTALFVGLLQWRIQSRRLKHNLFEKRYAIYHASRMHLAEIMKKQDKDDINAYLQFRAATDPAEFLFPESVYNHLRMVGVHSASQATGMAALT